MIIETYVLGPLKTNCYLVICEKTRNACVIDPAMGSFIVVEKVLQEKNCHLSSLFLTHSHWDHIVDVAAFHRAFPVKIYLHEADHKNLENPGSDHIPMLFSVEEAKADVFYEEEKRVYCGEISFQVIFTPGHSPGSVCLYVEKEKVLFSGDTLFKGTIGNIQFPHSSAEKMWHSLKKLSKLPKDTIVYPGHGEPTQLEKEAWISQAKELFYS